VGSISNNIFLSDENINSLFSILFFNVSQNQPFDEISLKDINMDQKFE